MSWLRKKIEGVDVIEWQGSKYFILEERTETIWHQMETILNSDKWRMAVVPATMKRSDAVAMARNPEETDPVSIFFVSKDDGTIVPWEKADDIPWSDAKEVTSELAKWIIKQESIGRESGEEGRFVEAKRLMEEDPPGGIDLFLQIIGQDSEGGTRKLVNVSPGKRPIITGQVKILVGSDVVFPDDLEKKLRKVGE
ncbi:hypothetical protein KKC60_03335 [Patescibacteria group bacterium]|nr:hypothetical protein [Patescibacteria group bacterium]